MRRLALKTLTGLVLILVVAMPAAARQGPGGGFGPPPPPDPVLGPVHFLLRDLGLTEDQNAKIRTLVETALDGGLADLFKAGGEARHALEMATWDPAATGADILAAQQSLADRGHDIAIARRALAAQVLSVLTDDQRTRLAAKLASLPPPPDGPPGPPPPPPGSGPGAPSGDGSRKGGGGRQGQ